MIYLKLSICAYKVVCQYKNVIAWLPTRCSKDMCQYLQVTAVAMVNSPVYLLKMPQGEAQCCSSNLSLVWEAVQVFCFYLKDYRRNTMKWSTLTTCFNSVS